MHALIFTKINVRASGFLLDTQLNAIDVTVIKLMIPADVDHRNIRKRSLGPFDSIASQVNIADKYDRIIAGLRNIQIRKFQMQVGVNEQFQNY